MRFGLSAAVAYHKSPQADRFAAENKSERRHKAMISEGKDSQPGVAMDKDLEFMNQAIRLARMARDRGNTPVGSVVVCPGGIVAEGMEAVRSEKDLTAHAEVKAVREACRLLDSLDLTGCTLYMTAEPCFMCSYVIRSARISRVVTGRGVPNVGGISSNHPILTDPEIPNWPRPPAVVTGVLLAECSALFQPKLIAIGRSRD